jgi:hypothetical protein
VVLADGAWAAETFQSIWQYRLKDSLYQVAYATHPCRFHFGPQNTAAEDRRRWERRFSYLTSRGAAVIVTEWNSHADIQKSGTKDVSAPFLDYLRQKGIGITAHAFDVKGTMVKTLYPDWEPTTLQEPQGCWRPSDAIRCGPEAGSPVKDLYARIS